MGFIVVPILHLRYSARLIEKMKEDEKKELVQNGSCVVFRLAT